MTEEEAYPKWAGKALARVGANRFASYSLADGGGWVCHETDTLAHTAYKVVCRPCNNGWMSVLENNAKGFLEPMVCRLERAELDRRRVDWLAGWCANRAIVSDYALNPGRPFYTGSQRARFRACREPPEGFHLWIAGAARAVCMRRAGVAPAGHLLAGAGFTAHHMVYQLGHFLFQSLTAKWDRAAVRARERAPGILQPAGFDSQVREVWSFSVCPLIWPAPALLDDAGVERLAYRFFPDAERIAGDPIRR